MIESENQSMFEHITPANITLFCSDLLSFILLKREHLFLLLVVMFHFVQLLKVTYYCHVSNGVIVMRTLQLADTLNT